MRRIGWIGLLLVTVSIGGCGKTTGDGRSDGEYRIAVIPKATTHGFWKSVHAGAAQAAKELGNVTVIWKGPLLQHDREGQINVVQDVITQHVSGIVLAPLDSQALIPSVRDARAEGIPTVIFDSGLGDPASYVSYVATDNLRGGELAARRLGQVLAGKGNVALMRCAVGSQSTEQRERGFLDGLAKDFPNIKVVESTVYAGATPETSVANSAQLLLKYGQELDGVFTVCEPNNDGMLKALEEANLAGKIKFVGFDASPAMIQALLDGKAHGIVLQDPVQMGYLAVKIMVAHLAGKPVEKRIHTGEFLATPENIKTPAIDKLLHPAQY